jgi:hypothetical protein
MSGNGLEATRGHGHATGETLMSPDVAQTPSAQNRFDVSLEDFRKQAEALGFWRGLGVGFLSAFFLFDNALAQGAGMHAIVAFAMRNGTAIVLYGAAALAAAVLARTCVRAVRAGRERRVRLKHVRERLGL